MSNFLIHNRQLFSEVYLREMRAAQMAQDVAEAARKTIGEWRQEYSDRSQANSFVRQTLSTLDVAYSPREGGGFTLWSDAAKECATGICLLADDDDLGRTVKGRHHQVQLLRELRAANLKWGVLTNGAKWRLCCVGVSAPYETFLEADLDGLLQSQELVEFSVFYRFFGGAAWSVGSGSTPETVFIGLDGWARESEKRTEAIERHLKSRVETVLQRLCLGFVKHDGGAEYSREELDEVYRNAIYLLYRILFLFYAEARGLLPTENPIYAPQSLHALIELAAKRETQGVHDADALSLWKRLTRLFVVVDDGDDELGVNAYNGGLFSDAEKPYLKDHRIGDEYLAPALFDLAFETVKSGVAEIDYRDLSVRHLGTLYEGLLEYKLNMVRDEPVVVRDDKNKRTYVPQSQAGTIKKSETILEIGEVYFADDKGERKASGSYYTPEDVVQYIVSNTIGPKLEEIRRSLDEELKGIERERTAAANSTERESAEHYGDARILAVIEEKLLHLKVLDPAMGSGHFLVAAGQMISDAIVETLNATPWPNETISSEPLLWKRRVVERCLYGVDKNPLAQELAKLSLWIASASRGKPLTFLDHHLKVGNSLLGTPLQRLSTLPPVPGQKKGKAKSAGASTPVTGDLFAATRHEVIAGLLGDMAQINAHDSDRIEDVKWKETAARKVDERASRLRAVADVWLATLFGLQSDGAPLREDEWLKLLDEVAVNFAPEQWRSRVAGSSVLTEAHEIASREAFFHWELEFPDALGSTPGAGGASGFDGIIANPPYVGTKADAAIQELYRTAPCGDLYAWIMERALGVLGKEGNFGTIVPLSLMFSRSFKTLRETILERKIHARFANFDIRPASIFGTAEAPNSQRATIALLTKIEDENQIFTTRLIRWSSEDRPQLIANLKYANATFYASIDSFPKIGEPSLAEFWKHASNNCKTIQEAIYKADKEIEVTPELFHLYVSGSARYFLTAMPKAMRDTGLVCLSFEKEWTRDVAFLALNSNVFYWLWCVLGDGFHVTGENIISMVLPDVPDGDAGVLRLRDALLDAAESCATYQMKWGEKIPNYNFNKRMDILLEIDDWIVRHVAPDLNLPRDIFAQYKSNSFLRPLDLSSLMSSEDAGDE